MEVTATLTQFSDRLSPIFVRDLRQGLRAQTFVWAFVILQALALLATLTELFVSQLLEASGGLSFSGALAAVVSIGFGFLLPLTLFGALQPEIGKGKNIELLLSASLTRWQIVWGKLLVSGALSGLLLVSLLPYLFLRYFLGNVELISVLGLAGSSYLANLSLSAIVIGASGYPNHIARAFVVIYFYLIYRLTLLGVTGRFLLSSAPSGWGVVLPSIAILIASAVTVAMGLQLGRARIKLFQNPLEPPTSTGVFAIGFLIPIAHGISSGLGGFPVAIVVLALLLWLVLQIDRGPAEKKRLKGAQP